MNSGGCSVTWTCFLYPSPDILSSSCNCIHKYRSTNDGLLDTGVVILQSLETHSLNSDDLHCTNCETTSTNWMVELGQLILKGVNSCAITYFTLSFSTLYFYGCFRLKSFLFCTFFVSYNFLHVDHVCIYKSNYIGKQLRG